MGLSSSLGRPGLSEGRDWCRLSGVVFGVVHRLLVRNTLAHIKFARDNWPRHADGRCGVVALRVTVAELFVWGRRMRYLFGRQYWGRCGH